jgi:TPR repeat protein
MTPASSGIFISYRHQDNPHAAGRLARWLAERVAPAQVFLDDSIDPGQDFVDAIDQAVSACDVVLVVIGERWIAATDKEGRRRLTDPRDWVVWEIKTALARNIQVIPVLVDGARPPDPRQLPPALQALARRNSVPLRHDTFDQDAERVLETLRQSLSSPATVAARTPQPPLTDVEEATYRQAAEAGDTVAMDNLGVLLQERRGDTAQAEHWWRRAAEAGNPAAMNNLAVVLKEHGDTSQAERWWRRATQKGDTDAMHNLGVLLEELGFVQPAQEQYRHAANRGYAPAMVRLGLLLQRHGDHAEAAEWYRRAGSAGHLAAMYNLGVLLEESGEFALAAQWYQPAADAGHIAAMHNLGVVLYQLGATAQAEHWWQQAAEAGFATSMNNLGVVFNERGDTVQAEEWWRRAAEAGDVNAKLNLQNLQRR